MDEDERAALLDRVNSQGATVGASMPETVDIGGDELALREFVIEARALEEIPPETEQRLDATKRTLREERDRRMERLESDPLDGDEAEQLADEIVGLDRALNALETIRHPGYGEQSKAATVEDHRRWLGFLDDIS